jgi:hypothetical protein
MSMLTRKAVTALLHAATGNMARPATAEAGLARLDKLLAARGIDGARPDAAALLLRYGDGEPTAEATWSALLELAPAKANAPAIPPTPQVTNGLSDADKAAIEAALADKGATVIPAKPPKEPRPAPAATKAARTAAKGKAQAKPAQAPAAAQAVAKPAKTDASRYRLPAPGTKYRRALDMLRRPGGATNKELNAETGLEGSWASTGRTWAERYGLIYTRTEERTGGHVQARLTLTGTVPGEDEAAA